MSRKKLTLSVEERLTKKAKAIAEKRGTSVSRMVESFFGVLEEAGEGQLESGRFSAPLGEDAEEEESFLGGYTPSPWAQRWRGAFQQEGTTYPDSSEWEEKVIAEEIRKKHS